MDLNTVDQYIENIRKSTDKLIDALSANPDSAYLTNLQFTLERIKGEIEFKSAEFTEKEIPKAFEEGEEEANQQLEVSQETQGENVREVFAENAVTTNKKVYALNAFSELSNAITLASDNVLKAVNGVIKANPNLPMIQLQKVLQAELEQEAIATGTPFNIKYSNGKQVAFESYAKMVARSSMLESANVGAFSRAEALGNDLVKCTEYGSTCPICSKYEGRVYSISGKNPNYPPLYGTALKKGYSLIHPNCRHEFLPFNEKFYTDEQLRAERQASNKPFVDDRNEKDREQYAKGQALNQKLRSEQLEYEQFKLNFGDDLPYKTLGAFRRAKRTGSEKYEDLKQLVVRQ